MMTDADRFDIDRKRLEEECANQSRMYREVAHRLAEARRDAKIEEASLDVIKADVGLEIRRDPKEFGLDKVTEDAVKTAVTLSRKVRDARDRVIQAEYRVDLLAADVYALAQRKSMLEKTVELWRGEYFSDPRPSSPAYEEVQKRRASEGFDRRTKTRSGE